MFIAISFNAATAKAASLIQTAQTETTIDISWSQERSSVYEVLNYSIGWGEDMSSAKAMAEAGQVVVPNTASTYQMTGLKPGTKYYTYVVANCNYKKTESKKVNGKWQTITTKEPRKDVRELGGKIIGSTLNVNWEKIKGINKFNVYVATSKGGSFKKVKTVNGKKTSANIKKIGKQKVKGNKTYYVYVEGVKKVNGATYTTGLLYITPISKSGASSPIYYNTSEWNH
ncbi:fibronectin type III domain-containing protein [Butyrivibrio sp. AE3004]|uniref:fibronectin type III domain-containing protein n=1 Tax=Butyrivibrio sp. AE3004 TaxID=1506994 RepID=UPI000494270D|nr:fibronectin type III domain-containing protein [Butyrivibrio sp. AE3004]